MSEKIIIFDLDHTLGFFEQLVHIMNYSSYSCHELLYMFPECFRPLLLDFLKTLVLYKKSGKIKTVLLYSNNNNDVFVKMVIDYIHTFLDYLLFDTVITLEHPLRKSKSKDYHDLILMSDGMIHDSSTLCFIDDKIHPLMNIPNVCYIKCEGYVHVVKHDVVIERIHKDIPIYPLKKRCLNLNNQCHISRLLIQKIRVFILR
jgi:hypothetical protein